MIPIEAKICPYCRKKQSVGTLGKLIVVLFIVCMFASALGEFNKDKVAKNEPEKTEAEKKAENERYNRALSGAGLLKRNMRNPDSFKIASAFIVKDTGDVCYEYRAQNGFGGMNVEKAILMNHGKTFITEHSKSFSSSWNKCCAERNGEDVTAYVEHYSDAIRP